jgi:transposase-like protein
MSVLTHLGNRGLRDVFFVVCDGLKGLPGVVANVWPPAIVQTCIIHLIRNTFRLTSSKYWSELEGDPKPVHTAVNTAAARAAFDELAEKCAQRYPGNNAWDEFILFLDYDVEIRRVLRSTNAIESLNARYRRAVKARGHFPTEQAALKTLYLVTRSLDPTGTAGHDGRSGGNQRSTRRDHLRRPILGSRNLLMNTAGNTVTEIVPRVPPRRGFLSRTQGGSDHRRR